MYRISIGFVTVGLFVSGRNFPIEEITLTAQFLVLKDNVLNRTKEVNVNTLFDKLTGEFIDHYKVKLLNVASGKFDCVYSRRYKGESKKSNEGSGFQILPKHQHEEILGNITRIDDNVYTVPSFTEHAKQYCVDMNVGICECFQGQSGAPCRKESILPMCI